MRKIFLMSSVLFVAPFVFGESGEVSAQCVATTDCASLGYTEASCPNGGIKCPFGNSWSCKGDGGDVNGSGGGIPGQCTGYAKNCVIGQILNSDGTCTTDKVSGKLPIGVVVAIKDKCGYAMTASPIEWGIRWVAWDVASSYDDIPSLPNYVLEQIAITDFDVSGNMTKIIQAGDASIYPAAYAALNFTPSFLPTSMGKWALPTAGVLNSLYINLDAINNTISKLGGTQLKNNNEYIWSSTESSYLYVWSFCMGIVGAPGGVCVQSKSGFEQHTVRPVIAF